MYQVVRAVMAGKVPSQTKGDLAALHVPRDPFGPTGVKSLLPDLGSCV